MSRNLLRRFIATAAALFVFSLASAAFADWGQTFSVESTRSLASGARIMVVEVGAPASSAAESLRATLRGAEGVELVMDGTPLGDVSQLGDDEIISKMAVYPVEAVLIVRVFPAKDGLGVAVLTYAETATGIRRAASVTEGTKLKAALISERRVEDSAGPAKTLVAPEPTAEDIRSAELLAAGLGNRLGIRASAVAATEAQALQRGRFQREKVVFGEATWEAYLGVFNEPVYGEDFYRAIGQNDLAARYANKAGWKTAGLISSGVATALGAGLLFVGIPVENDAMTYTGVGTLGVGVVGLVVSLLIDPHPVSEARARELADEHNHRVANELGITTP